MKVIKRGSTISLQLEPFEAGITSNVFMITPFVFQMSVGKAQQLSDMLINKINEEQIVTNQPKGETNG